MTPNDQFGVIHKSSLERSSQKKMLPRRFAGVLVTLSVAARRPRTPVPSLLRFISNQGCRLMADPTICRFQLVRKRAEAQPALYWSSFRHVVLLRSPPLLPHGRSPPTQLRQRAAPFCAPHPGPRCIGAARHVDFHCGGTWHKISPLPWGQQNEPI